jgi:hypothetical protein
MPDPLDAAAEKRSTAEALAGDDVGEACGRGYDVA